jgi:hypothetical protein
MTHRLPDPLLPECAACGGQEPGTPEKPVKLADCSICGVAYCSEPCFSLHRRPAMTTGAGR